MNSAATCIGLGLDSFLISFALPAARAKSSGLQGRNWLSWAGAFGAGDALASLARELGPGSAFLALAFVAILGNLVRREGPLLAALPVLLCLDNLMLPRTPVDAMFAGVASFALAALGFAARGLAERFVAERHRRALTLAAVALCATAFLLE
jgi:hypothetical protein